MPDKINRCTRVRRLAFPNALGAATWLAAGHLRGSGIVFKHC
jgi:hypothetical protein